MMAEIQSRHYFKHMKYHAHGKSSTTPQSTLIAIKGASKVITQMLLGDFF